MAHSLCLLWHGAEKEKICYGRVKEIAMNVISDSQQLIKSTPEHTVNTTDLKSVNDRTKQQIINNNVGAATQTERKTDTVQISKTGAELSRESSTTSGNDSMELSADVRSEEKRISSGGIESVMTRYKEAQNFMAQIESGSINSTA